MPTVEDIEIYINAHTHTPQIHTNIYTQSHIKHLSNNFINCIAMDQIYSLHVDKKNPN